MESGTIDSSLAALPIEAKLFKLFLLGSLARMFHKLAQPTVPQPMCPDTDAAGRGENGRAALDGGKFVQQRARSIGLDGIYCPTGRAWSARAEHRRHRLVRYPTWGSGGRLGGGRPGRGAE